MYSAVEVRLSNVAIRSTDVTVGDSEKIGEAFDLATQMPTSVHETASGPDDDLLHSLLLVSPKHDFESVAGRRQVFRAR
jgi:hypothetical protein